MSKNSVSDILKILFFLLKWTVHANARLFMSRCGQNTPMAWSIVFTAAWSKPWHPTPKKDGSTGFLLPFLTSGSPTRKTYIAPQQKWSTESCSPSLHISSSRPTTMQQVLPSSNSALLRSWTTRPSQQQDICIPPGQDCSHFFERKQPRPPLCSPYEGTFPVINKATGPSQFTTQKARSLWPSRAEWGSVILTWAWRDDK